MRYLAIFVLSFAALAAAIPYVIHDHSNGHRARSARAGSITGRSESYDGSCGTWGGATCRVGFCCGSNGWCGNAEEHCGAGCQSGFGECGSRSSPEHGSPPPSSVSGEPLYGPPSGGPPSYGQPSYGPPSSITDYPVQTSSPSSIATVTSSSELPSSATPSATYPSSSSESTTSEPSQSTSPVESASPTSPSSEPTTSAAPTDSTSSTSTYGGSTPTPTSGGSSQRQGGPYINTFKGDGSQSNGWPQQDQWLPFETLWDINQEIMNSSCSNAWALGSGTDNTEQELAEVKSAIEDISSKTGVEKAFIYVVMQQESLGCVRVRTTSNSHANPGLFQSNQGAGSCNDGGNLQIPCPQSEINQMVEDGVAGTPSGDGLQQLLGQATGEAAQKYYRAARMYNSGSLDASGSLGRAGATACYCSDIANRLLGWSQGTSKCTAAEVSV